MRIDNVNKIKELMAGKNKYVVIGCVIVLVFIIILTTVFINSTYSIGDNVSIDTVRSIINDKESEIIYILNSESSNDYNKKILSYLEDENIVFSVYDTSKVSESEYLELLSVLGINSELFDVPAIVYINDGMMFANIININDMDIVSQFILDYDLKTVM